MRQNMEKVTAVLTNNILRLHASTTASGGGLGSPVVAVIRHAVALRVGDYALKIPIMQSALCLLLVVHSLEFVAFIDPHALFSRQEHAGDRQSSRIISIYPRPPLEFVAHASLLVYSVSVHLSIY